MNLSSVQSHTISIVPDSTSGYNKDKFNSETEHIDNQPYHRPHLELDLGDICCDDTLKRVNMSATPCQQSASASGLDVERRSEKHGATEDMATCLSKAEWEDEERHRRSAEPQDPPHSVRYTTLLEPEIYMQRVLAEDRAAYMGEKLELDAFECGTHLTNTKFGDTADRYPLPAQPKSTRSHLIDRTQKMLFTSTSLAPTESGEDDEESFQDASSLRHSLQGIRRGPVSLQEGAPSPIERSHRISIPNSACKLQSSRKVHQVANLQALVSAFKDSVQVEDMIERESLRAIQHQTQTKPPDSSLFSSTGREYGLGDCTKGYLSGHYVTCLDGEMAEEKKERKRDMWKWRFHL